MCKQFAPRQIHCGCIAYPYIVGWLVKMVVKQKKSCNKVVACCCLIFALFLVLLNELWFGLAVAEIKAVW